MTLIGLIVALVIVGVLLWLVNCKQGGATGTIRSDLAACAPKTVSCTSRSWGRSSITSTASCAVPFARKLACALFARFDLIAHEDLRIARMVHGNLAKSIHDAAWGQFLGALQSKAESAGKWCVPVDPRGTSQACAACGAVAKKELPEREHRCDCGFIAHRDVNAAQNILARGLRVGLLTEARGSQ